MIKRKEEYYHIIASNADLVDNSLVQFIVKCWAESAQEEGMSTTMYVALAEVLEDAFQDYKSIVDIITNDEKYFKWDRLDDFNHVRNQTKGSYGRRTIDDVCKDPYSILAEIWEGLWWNCNEIQNSGTRISSKFLNDVRSYAPEIDFTIIGRECALRSGTLKPIIGVNEGYWTDKHLQKGLGDLYVGVRCWEEDYPESIRCEDYHNAYTFRWGDTRQREEPKDMGCYPGRGNLIYVPGQKLIDDNILDVQSVTTALPRNILEKYGLPCTDNLKKLADRVNNQG